MWQPSIQGFAITWALIESVLVWPDLVTLPPHAHWKWRLRVVCKSSWHDRGRGRLAFSCRWPNDKRPDVCFFDAWCEHDLICVDWFWRQNNNPTADFSSDCNVLQWYQRRCKSRSAMQVCLLEDAREQSYTHAIQTFSHCSTNTKCSWIPPHSEPWTGAVAIVFRLSKGCATCCPSSMPHTSKL